MRFATVQGIGLPIDDARFELIVTLDDRVRVHALRREAVQRLPSKDEPLAWHVDQYTQETIGTTLAEQGWEVVSTVDRSNERDDSQVASSPAYLVRRAVSEELA